MQTAQSTWTQIKNLVDNHNWLLRAVPEDGGSLVYASNGTLSFEAFLADSSSDYLDFTTNYQAITTVEPQTELAPFGSKKLPDGRSLFRRIHGLKLDLDGTSNTQSTVFSVPYVSAKITSTEIVGAALGDRIDFKVLDTPTGTVSTIPNYTLNQFGFGVYPSAGRYEQRSEYDADLFSGLQLEVSLTPVNTDIRTVYFNLVLHEVV